MLPTAVRQGDFSAFVGAEGCLWFLWLTHLAIGEITFASWEGFLDWFNAFNFTEHTSFAWRYISNQIGSPVAQAIIPECNHGDLSGLAKAAISLGGPSGSEEWRRRIGDLHTQLKFLRRHDLSKLLTYGPGVLPADVRDRAVHVLDSCLDPIMQPIGLDQLGGRNVKLSAEDFDRLSEWFSNLSPESPWRNSRFAERCASAAVRLKRLQTPQFAVYLPYLSRIALSGLAIDAVTEGSDEDLKFLLAQFARNDHRDNILRYGMMIPGKKRRQITMRLLSLRDDSDVNVREGALLLVGDTCASVAFESEGPRSAIRSRDLDEAHNSLISNMGEVERSTGIALYAVRPPRSVDEWSHFGDLLTSATEREINDYWRWVLPHCAELANDASGFAGHITLILKNGVQESLVEILIDVMRKILPRQDQSLSRVVDQLSLPKLGVQ